MSIKIIQQGSGATRDVALMYLVGPKAKDLAAVLGPEVCVLSETASSYKTSGPGGVTLWEEAIALAQGAGAFEVGRIWLIGFSAGCQGVRTQLLAGCPASYILACDGIHMPLGQPEAYQVDPWRSAASKAKMGLVTFSVSMSATAATEFRPTRASAEYLFDWNGCMGSYISPCVEKSGSFRLYGATHGGGVNPADEHMDQLRVLLPKMIEDAKSGGSGLVELAMVGAGLAAGVAIGWLV